MVAVDASPGQVGKVERLARHRGVPCMRWGTRGELGRALGASPLSALAVTDRSLAARLATAASLWEAEEGI